MTEQYHIYIPEPPAEMTASALGEMWAKRSELSASRGPVLKGVFFIRKALENLVELPINNLFTVVTVAVSVFMFSGLLLLVSNMHAFGASLASSRYVTVFLKEGTSGENVKKFEEELRKDSNVASVSYVSKEDALGIMKRDFGDNGALLDELGEDNPLPASFDVVLSPLAKGIMATDEFVAKLKGQAVVGDVAYNTKWAAVIESLMKTGTSFALVILVIVFSIVVFLISSTIRLVMHEQREEVEIMRLIGATDKYIRIPYMLLGGVHGALGALGALVVLKVCFWLFARRIEQLTVFGSALPKAEFLSSAMMVGVISMGIFVGVIGSLVSVRRLIHE